MIFLAIFSVSCIDETYFGESTQANIITFTIEGEMSNKIEPLIDWRDVGTVDIVVPASFDLAKLKVTNVVCSQLAHFTTNPDTLTNFTKPVELTVVAEKKGVQKKWIITVVKKEIEKTQIAFSSFTRWTPAYNPSGTPVTIKGKEGFFPGNGKDYSPWQSSIEGNAVALSGLSDFSVYPQPDATTAKYARLTTLKTTSGALMGAGIAPGGLFTGNFVMNVAYVSGPVKAPRKMINSGVPFYSRPKGVKFDVRYKAGDQMVDGKLKPIKIGEGKPTQDSCDIMFILQNRLTNPDEWIRVATAALRVPVIGNMNNEETGFVTVELPFIYGRPTAEQLAAKPYQQIGGSQGELYNYKFTKNGSGWDISEKPVPEVYAEDPSMVEVDSFTAMFTCSAYGDLFYGAVGSTLDVKNVELIYE